MAIQQLKDVPHQSLVGKFICIPARYRDQSFGWPALVEKVTAARLTYRRLPRGAWDEVEREWRVCPMMISVEPGPASVGSDGLEGDDRNAPPEQCSLSNVKFVCDTAQEAITLFYQALATCKAIEAFRKAALARLDAQALAGELLSAPYLTTSQAN
ncbi:hypothetical protein WL29_20610 [Burkholderia ubonensis]|uniref:Uncharacterized protein n=1 Tax=Burkholderia ubonensis TaxID=101571 RepID=A0A106QCW3_9BURK|nr:hypothetical protein [Burkholderia ubonensis]KWA83769.1 hypothetical protein WL29_20610 [Burkholderia ubonensis]